MAITQRCNKPKKGHGIKIKHELDGRWKSKTFHGYEVNFQITNRETGQKTTIAGKLDDMRDSISIEIRRPEIVGFNIDGIRRLTPSAEIDYSVTLNTRQKIEFREKTTEENIKDCIKDEECESDMPERG